MPLLNKKSFERREPPAGISPNDKVYYLASSNEIFVNYDEYFERTIQLNSTVWSCEFTGKTGLTFFEAMQSENDAMKALDDFPKNLEIPILFLVHKFSCRGRFDDLLNDVSAFMKDRYFIGEECYYTENVKRRMVKVISSSLVSEWNVDEDNFNPKEFSMSPADLCRYSVQIMDDSIGCDGTDDDGLRENLPHHSLNRAKGIVSKPKLKLFLKNSCYMNSDRYQVKDRFLSDGVIGSLSWELVFCGPEPLFPQTPMIHRGRNSKPLNTSIAETPIKQNGNENGGESEPTPNGKTPRRKSDGKGKISEKRKGQILAQQEELSHTFDMAKRFSLDLSRYQQTDRLLPHADILTLKDAIKAAREQDRDQAREAKRLKIRAKYEWNKKRDDLECDDLAPLPTYPAIPLPDWISESDLAEYLTILQFFNAFQDLLPLKEFRGHSNVTLSDIIMAIRCGDPQQSPFADLMRVLLSARTDRGDEEDGDEADVQTKEEAALIQLQNCDPIHPVYGDAIRETNRMHEQLRLTHGQSVRHLPVDWMTLTETIRLIFNTSGYYSGMSTHRHRLFARGNYKGYEDAGFVFRLEHPEIMAKLETETVFELTPTERLLLMKTFINQLLSYSKFRSHHEEQLNQLWEQKRELRRLRNWDKEQEQEAKDARLAREYELEQLEAAGQNEKPAKIVSGKETNRLKVHLKAIRESRRSDRDELDELLLAGVLYIELDLADIVVAREEQKAKVYTMEKNLLNSIFEISSMSSQLHLGRDRAFRNYFLINAIPIVVVENPVFDDHIGNCTEATSVADFDEYGSEIAAVHALLGCSGDMDTCCVHGKGMKQRPRWSYIDTVETLDKLLAARNVRGIRESELFDEITFYRQHIEDIIAQVGSKASSGLLGSLFMADKPDPITLSDKMDWEQEMGELLLDLEEKMAQGLLGRLPASVDRMEWRRLLLETGDITSLINEPVILKGHNEEEVIWTAKELANLNSIQKLAVAFLQLVQGIALKFYRAPFVQPIPHEAGAIRASATFLRWQRALLECQSVPSLALFLSTLEPAILWDKSRLQGKCRTCRRKGAAESLVLCGDCGQCFHLECVRLPTDEPAPLDWMCSECSASMRKKAAAEKRRAAREAAAAEAEEEDMYEDGPDENSITESEFESSQSSMDIPKTSRTSSGRIVKKVVYKESVVPVSTPPLKTSRRVSTRSNGHNASYNNDVDSCDSDASVARSSKKRRTDHRNEQPTPNRGQALGLREMDSEAREKMGRLEEIIRAAMKLGCAWPFLEPVDPKAVPDYYDIITRPIDLRTMINKLKNHDYNLPEEVRSDMYLLVANCKEYNEEGSEIFECAEEIEIYFCDQLKLVFQNKKSRR